uniref:Uncharacterized protein n=1 Tax=Trichogramma kaykai TaxID=54128 RepID=A0ABD2WWP7_9HYME
MPFPEIRAQTFVSGRKADAIGAHKYSHAKCKLQFWQFEAIAKRWNVQLAYAIALHCHHAYTCIRIHKRRQHAENIIAERTLQEYTRVEKDCAHSSLHPKGLFLARTIQHAEQVRCLQSVPWHIIDSRRYAKKAA